MPYTEDGVGWRRTDTSVAAALKATPAAPIIRAQVLAALRGGPMIGEEVAERIGLSILSVRPRLTELSHSGLIEDTGERRANANGRSEIVWRRVERSA